MKGLVARLAGYCQFRRNRRVTGTRSRLGLTFAFLIFLLAVPAFACNIPVFRYALERWRTDKLELMVFTSGKLTNDQSQKIAKLEKQSVAAGGSANIEIRQIDTRKLDNVDADLWQSLQSADSKVAAPYVVVRGSHMKGPFYCWQGHADSANFDRLVDSPVRAQLAKKLLNGNSIVWLVIKSKREQANKELLAMLDEQIKALANKIELPEGIGLPGSELFSEVPLLLNYSVLEIDRDAEEESFLLGIAEGFQPEAFEEGEPLVMPVFGRGRALEVIPADQMTSALVRDLTQFLCAACSCQVKEQNPGFDLLLNVDWDTELFGEDGDQPPESAEGLGQKRDKVYLQIPPGRKPK